MEKRTLVLLAICVQILAVLSLAAKYWYADSVGRTVLVRAYGYDPIDPTRGEYAAVSYGQLESWTGVTDFDRDPGRDVYVLPELTASGEFVAVRAVLGNRPEEFAIRAKIVSDSFERPEYSYVPAEGSSPSLSGTFLNSQEWVSKAAEPATESASKDSAVPYTKFRVGSGAIAGTTSTGSVFALYADMAECKESVRYVHFVDAFGSGSAADAKRAVALPEDLSGYEGLIAEKCGSFGRILVTGVHVPKVLRLDYLADRFFVSERTGAAVERLIRERPAYAEWGVSRFGTVVRSIRSGDTVIR